MLSAIDLVKTYGGRRVVDGISLAVERGEIVGLLGPNGAGKTTSFRIIVGWENPDSGRVLLDGREITPLPMYRRARLGMAYLPQEPSVFRKMSVRENIRAVLEFAPLTRSEQRSREEEALEKLGLAALADRSVLNLSGGERRRVEIARALALRPGFILLDEPFSGVDPITIQELRLVIRDLAARDIGILVTDHNVRETLSITDRAYLVFQGRVIFAGPGAELVENPEARRFYLGDSFRL